MKNILPALTLCSLLFFGCQKNNDSQPDSNTGQTKVTFSVTDFSQSVGQISKTGSTIYELGDTLQNHADFLYVYIFPSSGTAAPVYIEQNSASANFGNPTVNLAPGNYLAVFVASKLPTAFTGTSRYSSLAMQPGPGDVFINKLAFTVTSENKTEPVRLTRWTGAIEVNIEDAIPSNAAKLVIETNNNASGWVFSAGQYTGADNTFTSKEFVLTDADRGQVNRKFMMYILNQGFNMTFTIKALDSQNIVIAQKTVEHVNVTRNKKTLLSGKLFTTITSFNVAVSPVWNAPSAPITF